MHVITLLTDFGTEDAYAASMKGVILNLHPKAVIVDITHEVPPQDILQASFLLGSCYSYFPKGTVHITVVDPGVGSERRILCVKTPHAIFLAPDNGVLTSVLAREKSYEIVEVASAAYFLKDTSFTFHGRDQFAPLAAHLSKKPRDFNKLGPRVEEYEKAAWPVPEIGTQSVTGQILFGDRFGNLITNIENSHLKKFTLPPADIQAGSVKVKQWVRYYAEAPKGTPIGLVNSEGYVEIAVTEQNAKDVLGLCPGDPVVLSWQAPHTAD